jgi:phosphoglycolate phosphatase-like HAD superfamily hydrolase
MTQNNQTIDVHKIRMVVFDIDGTLADTAELVPAGQRRKPDDFLKMIGPSEVSSDLTRIPNVRSLTSNLNRCGIRVAVISSAPAAYAGTVCYLLGVEADTIIAANNDQELRTKADRLKWLAKSPKWQHLSNEPSPSIGIADVLYIGDMPEDSLAASEAGCKFQHIDSYILDATKSNPLAQLETLCKSIVSGALSPSERGRLWQHNRFEARNHHQRDVIDNLNSRNYFVDLSIPELMLDPDGLPGVLNQFDPGSPIQTPLIDPSFVTREEYVENRILKAELFTAIAQDSCARLQDIRDYYPQLVGTKVFAHLKYWDSKLGQDLWKHIKNWQNMESGPEVNLFHLEFIALFMSASIWVQHKLFDPSSPKPHIVPLPSSHYNAKQPARASNRLARRISELTELPYFEILEKHRKIMAIAQGADLYFDSVILVDDQLTQGSSAEKAIAALCRQVGKVELRVWSSKHFKPEALNQHESDTNFQTSTHVLSDSRTISDPPLVKSRTHRLPRPPKEKSPPVISSERVAEIYISVVEPDTASNVRIEYFHLESSGRSGTLTLRVETRFWATKVRPHLPTIAEKIVRETGPSFSLRIQVIGEFRKVLESLWKTS